MIHKKLKQARENKGLSQLDVSKQLNISRQSISKWENNRGYPDIENLIRLSEIYDVSLDDLLLQKHKNNEHSQNDNYTHEGLNIEWMLLFMLLISLSIASPLGIIFLPFIYSRNKKNKKHHNLINMTCIICLIINIYSLIIIAGDYIHINQEIEVTFIENN